MIQTKKELERALKGSRFAKREIVAMPVLDTVEVAFAVALDKDEIEVEWRADSCVQRAGGRWPRSFGTARREGASLQG